MFNLLKQEKMKKKIFVGLVTLITIIGISLLTFNPKPAQATDCKWKQLDCPGWGTGTYEACLVIGDGNSCTCGEVTRNCAAQE